jgi:hypothetical protein
MKVKRCQPGRIAGSRLPGNVYVVDGARIRKISRDGIITTIAGDGKAGYSGDGIPAVLAELSGGLSVAADRAGSLYIADFGNERIRKITQDGRISTVGGGGAGGDGGPATSAQLYDPWCCG